MLSPSRAPVMARSAGGLANPRLCSSAALSTQGRRMGFSGAGIVARLLRLPAGQRTAWFLAASPMLPTHAHHPGRGHPMDIPATSSLWAPFHVDDRPCHIYLARRPAGQATAVQRRCGEASRVSSLACCLWNAAASLPNLPACSPTPLHHALPSAEGIQCGTRHLPLAMMRHAFSCAQWPTPRLGCLRNEGGCIVKSCQPST